MYLFLRILPYIALCLGILAMFTVYLDNKKDSARKSAKK